MKKIKYENLIEWEGPLKVDPFPGLPSLSKNQNPLVEKSFTFVSTFKSKKVLSFNSRNGDIRWMFDLPAYGGLPLVVDHKSVFAGTNMGVICLSKRSGKIKWKYEPYDEGIESFYSEPVKVGESIFLLDRYGNLHKLNENSGKLQYRIRLVTEMSGQFNSRIIVKLGKIYAVSTDGHLKCIEIGSGKLLWETSLNEGSIHSPIILGNVLYIQGNTCVFEVNLKNRNIEVHRFNGIIDICVKNGVLYVLDRKSNDKTKSILYEHKDKKKKLIQFSDSMSIFVSYKNKDILVVLGSNGITFFDLKRNTKKMEIYGLFSSMPFVSKNKIFAIDLLHEIVCMRNPMKLYTKKDYGRRRP